VDNITGDRTQINILEYLAILITYALAQRCLNSNPTLAPDSYPTILVHSDNTTAVSWAQKTISSADPIAKHVARLACLLQLNARLGLKVIHIEGEKNDVSDALSRIFTNPNSPLLPVSDQIQTLRGNYPQLQNCNHCLVPPNLLSLVTQVLSRRADKLVLEWSTINKRSIQDKSSMYDGWNLLG
jgi:hypothetical protein